MKQKSKLLALALCFLTSCAAGAAQGSSSAGVPAHPELLVSTQWLADHLRDPNLVIVQIGHDDEDYRAGHVPGARYLAMDKFATGQTPPGTELLPPDELKKNLEEIGIGDDYIGRAHV